ncbi:MAG: hypothetical protein R2715_14605 [Ilumatobacteraceae bacterium]
MGPELRAPDDIRTLGLPRIDAHAVVVDADVDRTWAALLRFTTRRLATRTPSHTDRLLRTEHPGGFEVYATERPRWLVLHGGHRFSSYAIDFRLEPQDGRTILTATSNAAFDRPGGRVYRALVISSHAHVLATTVMLRAIARLAEGTPQSSAPTGRSPGP